MFIKVKVELSSCLAGCWGKISQYPLERRLGGLQIQCGHYGGEKNLFLLPGIEPKLLGYPTCSLVNNTD
jgi:hypothetical protein